MKIAVASGKGGTGKTTVSIALAETLARRAVLLDCDVEEPNCHLFLPGEILKKTPVNVMVPEFHAENCTGCGKCSQVCRFNAIASLGRKMLIFQELCHSCGGCLLACKEKALKESTMQTGFIYHRNTSFDFPLYTGEMLVGHSLSVPLIKELKNYAKKDKINILDAPPGTACPMVTTLRGCDHVFLVTEPTPFGLHDLAGAVATLQTLELSCSVILNKAGEEDVLIEKFCMEKNIDIALKIPFSRKTAQNYASGKTLLQALPELKENFRSVLKRLGAL